MGFGKSGKGVIITDIDDITLLTLANVTAVKQDNPLSLTEDFRMIKMEIAAELIGSTNTETPIMLYLVDDEMDISEIGQGIAASGPLDRNDRLIEERATRPIFLVGMFGNDSNTLLGAKGQEGVVEKNVRWTFSNPEGWSLVAFNHSGGPLATGAIIKFVTKFFGVWLS